MAEAEKMDRGARRKARTRKKLLEAAAALCSEQSIEDISIVDITEAADVGLGTFYNHFESKQDLLAGMAEDYLTQYDHALDELVCELEDPAEVFLVSYRFTIRSAQDKAGWNIIRQFPNHLIRDRIEARSERDINRGIETGRFKIDSAEEFCRFLDSSVIGIMSGLSDGAVTTEQADTFVTYFLRLLGLDEAEARQLMEKPLPDAG
ncbi:TetR/AcrR family transcriptional regulator [Pseudomaricurvus alkylphenolicus]|jgi:AcrR family transcriptional regulator|uniref:TetR/AcrR family transcriptional regulator n=1 Tax=Pseudomaricurvus alkylphenolicus TaxID=1306991 RepID=UPI0014200723|nr:TetR/AcrR family transcriptional regulator [Pseudomaricurvus alkylphenolicus]NIB40123.1 TetR/AcrR family transcriptional regulator [Pseudomaricurvus alkylphenolicus]